MVNQDISSRVIQRIKNVCKGSALLSFIIGTILLAIFLITQKFDSIVTIGIYFVIIAFWYNLLIFIITLLTAIYYWQNRIELLGHCGLLLLNLPIAIGYFFIVLSLID
jgi:uncharacterized membrane protein